MGDGHMGDGIGFRPVGQTGPTAGDMIQAQKATAIPRIVCLRTALVPKDEGIIKKVSDDFKGETIDDILKEILSKAETDDEKQLAESIRKERSAEACTIAINDKTAKPEDKIDGFFQEKEHLKQEGDKKVVVRYLEMDIEVAAVEKGGNA